MEEALIAGLYEAGGELEARTIRNTRQGHTYGDIQATALWEHKVDEGQKSATVGSPHEAGYWEEFGTGEHALHGDGRKGWWVYIEGGSGYEGKTNTYHTREEAEKMAAFIKKEYGLTAHVTDGQEPNRPLHRAFQSGKAVVDRIFEAKLKGLG
jgi:hypothetical protein